MADDYAKNRQDSELVLAPGQFAYILDETKGHVNTLCGPIKTSLSQTDQTVIFADGAPRKTNPSQAIQKNIVVAKGEYVVLDNPANKQPEPGKTEQMTNGLLNMGQKENLPGPRSFALWFGQTAKVIQGHHLRSNQYLMVRVYDDEAAKANWGKSVIKAATTETEEIKPIVKGKSQTEQQPVPSGDAFSKDIRDSLVTGQLLIIKGTEVAFYIPPTGIEVLKDEENEYIRDAVTLETLEYSILLDESGNKDYVKGPAVVFPKPTQNFVSSRNDQNKRKFRAFELQETTGLHIKVISDYTESGKPHNAGEELFITGKDMPIYFPRPEHAIISYGSSEKYFATAIPAGEGRYVLDRKKGDVNLVKGPNMFLPNPIDQVVVKRILSEAECNLYYPGNTEALVVNKARWEELKNPKIKSLGLSDGIEAYPNQVLNSIDGMANIPVAAAAAFKGAEAASPMVADSLTRSQRYTPPRSITINSKYEGAVRIDVWSGYAVQIVNSQGARRTVVGPFTQLLEYDEKLQRLSLSTGKTKNTDQMLETAYLKHTSNPVKDVFLVKTEDLVNVELQVKYLVKFEDSAQDKWFSVDNYIQHLVDHMRSLVSNHVRRIKVQEFHNNATEIIRDLILGVKTDILPRPGRNFAENGMTVYDLELISAEIKDHKVADMLINCQLEHLQDAVSLERKSQQLVLTKGIEEAERNIAKEKESSVQLKDSFQLEAAKRKANLEMNMIRFNAENEKLKQDGIQEATKIASATESIKRDSKREDIEITEFVQRNDLERKVLFLVEEAKASEQRMKAVQPALVEALMAASKVGILEKVFPQLASLAFVNGNDTETTMRALFKGTHYEGMIDNINSLSPRRLTTSGNNSGGKD